MVAGPCSTRRVLLAPEVPTASSRAQTATLCLHNAVCVCFVKLAPLFVFWTTALLYLQVGVCLIALNGLPCRTAACNAVNEQSSTRLELPSSSVAITLATSLGRRIPATRVPAPASHHSLVKSTLPFFVACFVRTVAAGGSARSAEQQYFVVMGGRSSKLTPAEEQRLGKKCKTLSTTYQKCHKANPNKASACSNLEISLVMCYAGNLCKEAYTAHERCYKSLMNTGYYKGKRDCDETVNAMKACLKKYKLYPFDIK